ncbi:helix-turn-helix domain-containing protein [Paenibacillus alvei]|uniref:Helix-turn-helix domain-containing protein n=1 Tax=Paenibacillus alvei TaxID=44250 RepID=A0ABT4H3H2_PAEAL|nr:helix-turn-helix domain-containing protein [Paenibacillus alvei]MCY7484383.1 helix-turn-helix domain-containing protein [Paenibacillus alvei]MCY9763490.1 helix-turn-helix domain-containing protein [Paenibacillus alvei]MCY9767498.1 helix-turn-helix domain-containing protein [Paenibacillus alvei]
MSWNYFRSKLLLQYIWSYILIFLIPLVVLTIFIYQNAVNNLRSEIEQSNVNQLNQVKLNIDSRMTELRDIASRIAYDEQLTPYMIRHPYYSRDAISALGKYKANSSILEELFLYYRNTQAIYSPKGMTNVNVLFEQYYLFEDWNKKDIIHELETELYPIVRPAESVNLNMNITKSMLAYMIPITPNSSSPHGTVLFLMEESKLTGLMDTILNGFKGNTYIFDEKGRVLTQNNHGEPIPKNEIHLLSALGSGIHSLKLDNRQQSVVSVKSSMNGWTYVTAMPSEQFFGRVFHIQTFFLLAFAVVVLGGILAAVFLARKQYHPIHDLMEFAMLKAEATEATSTQHVQKSRNELEWIRKALHDYSARVDIQEPFARNQFLLMLLKHGKLDNPESEHIMDVLGIELTGKHYFVIAISWDEYPGVTDALHHRQHIAELLEEIEIPDYGTHAYGIELPHFDQFALIVTMNEDTQITVGHRMEQIVDALRIIVMESTHLIPSIGVGTAYENAVLLNQSYIEAASALEYRMANGKGSITYFDKLSHTPSDTFWIAKDSLLKLTQSLKQGNDTIAMQMIEAIFIKLKAERLSISLLRCICFDIMNTLLKTASELGLNELIRDIPGFTSFESLEELEKKLQLLAAHICEQVERNTESEQISLMDNAIAFIDQQYTDYNLSLEGVAQKFSISSSYLSRAFKEKTGSNFSQYIWQRRMDEVIRQLLTTSDPLKDIIVRVGYLDTPNFIRKFKKETGYTPGQYRKLHASSEQAKAAADADDES